MRYFTMTRRDQAHITAKLLSYLVCAFLLLAAPIAHAQGQLANQELFDKTGLTHSAGAIPYAITESIGTPRAWSPPFWNRFVKAWRATAPLAYRSEKILETIDQAFEKDLSDEHKRRIIAFFDTPLGKRIAEYEAAALKAQPAIQQFGRNPAAYADRVALYKELDQETSKKAPVQCNECHDTKKIKWSK